MLLEVGKFQKRHCRLHVRPASGIEFARGDHIKIVVGIDLIEQLLFFFRNEYWALLVDPAVQIRAGRAETGPIVGVVIYAVAENEIVQFKNGLLQMVGDAKTLKLDTGKFFAQLARPPPG